MNSTTIAFIERAALYINCPYIWQGKGDILWTPNGAVKNQFANHPMVFDCSGLVTYALWKATGLDFRMTHSSKTMLDTFPEVDAEQCGDLLIYPGHVAITLGNGLILDASGGDSTTNTPTEALKRGGRVQLHFNRRDSSTLLGIRRIPLDKSELRA